MLDPIVSFFTRIFHWIGWAIGQGVAWLLWPFVAAGQWYTHRGWTLKLSVGTILVALLVAYGWFFAQTQFWTNFDPDYVKRYKFETVTSVPGEPLSSGNTNVCGQSSIVKVASDLVDFNVDQNSWIPSTLMSKMGLFGLPWKYTPFFDNKAAFQLGVNEIVRRTALELVDRLGRVRGTSQIDQNLQNARQNIYYTEDLWYFSFDPFGPKSATPTSYRSAVRNLTDFNSRLARCDATFDPRADNLLKFLEQMASAIGSTSDILRDRIEQSNAGWFDFRADDRFWFAYGQLYALNGVMSAAKNDFGDVVRERNLGKTWNQATEQLRSALNMQPLIISNGNESAFIMPSHLATMGFYLLRVRSNMTEMRDILDR